jgi:DNA-binding NarL/FixJ family response regulator
MSSTIVIVDDSAGIRRVVRNFLESNTDWQICGEAEDGRAAVDLVRRFNPDFLVIDLAMPVMNGIDAVREIAAIAPKTKVVLFTIHDWEQLTQLAPTLGISAVLSKKSDRVLERLVALLREAAAQPEAAAQSQVASLQA